MNRVKSVFIHLALTFLLAAQAFCQTSVSEWVLPQGALQEFAPELCFTARLRGEDHKEFNDEAYK